MTRMIQQTISLYTDEVALIIRPGKTPGAFSCAVYNETKEDDTLFKFAVGLADLLLHSPGEVHALGEKELLRSAKETMDKNPAGNPDELLIVQEEPIKDGA